MHGFTCILYRQWPYLTKLSISVVLLFIQVCELDIIFNFEKAYFMLDELLLGGEIQETSKKNILKAIAAQDLLQEVSCLLYDPKVFLSFPENT